MGSVVEVKDILGLSQPLIKLLEVISNGTGRVYDDIFKAKAKAYEINKIGEAISKNVSLPIKYKNGDVSINSTDFQGLMKRATNRFIYQEAMKQKNIEAVVANAHKELEKETEVSTDKVDDDWTLRFFKSVEDISNEKMQELWGKILAGEIKKPKTYSLRTLDALKNITQQEAELFEKFTHFFFIYNNFYFLPNNDELLFKYNGSYGEILLLKECGLIFMTETILIWDFRQDVLINNKSVVMKIVEKNEDNKYRPKVYPLTSSGIELFKLINSSSNRDFSLEYFKFLKKNYSNSFNMSAYSIKSVNEGGKINYDDSIDLLS